MAHYLVINETKTYGRVIDAESSFEARMVLAKVNDVPVTDFFAIRKDLMGDKDWAMWNRIPNK